jgi:hypothetical protein
MGRVLPMINATILRKKDQKISVLRQTPKKNKNDGSSEWYRSQWISRIAFSVTPENVTLGGPFLVLTLAESDAL